ncbi:MAG: prevent-host-death protein [Desulfobulbaceae bacterium A2]|nr:MAG: prevent-host-death protein [Desulfobulbaceae bacterium A2]
MQKVNVKEARRNISRLLNEVLAGEEVLILRRDKPVARLQQIAEQESRPLRFPDRGNLRDKLPPQIRSSAALLREMRDERG